MSKEKFDMGYAQREAKRLYEDLSENLKKFGTEQGLDKCPSDDGGECNCSERILALQIAISVTAGVLKHRIEKVGDVPESAMQTAVEYVDMGIENETHVPDVSVVEMPDGATLIKALAAMMGVDAADLLKTEPEPDEVKSPGWTNSDFARDAADTKDPNVQ